MSIREITTSFHIFCPKYISPLSEFSHCFCPNLSIAFVRIPNCFCPNFGKKQWEISGKTQWEIRAKSNGKIWAKAMRKTRKAAAYISGKYGFCPNFPWLLPEFPTAFARIFRFQFFFLGGAQCPPAPCLLRLCYDGNLPLPTSDAHAL